ncbi:nickel pincer cofactor biosynthesis protein LarB [Bacillus sp. Marseille-P3661]|uniref:nickel pincer cofactor biosynthesis protein LarB n=1 Tax=Bacillus sp. Marseille-P3661 TaxID=1936234 RepID=UPI000C858EF9|nr:nickel pincer cofactor biosynthesis protein LarB [Bacillus sp. Marseille-P3661]
MQTNYYQLLQQVAEGRLSVEDAYEQIKGYEDLGFAKLDYQRSERKGFPEVIYGEGKTSEQIIAIFKKLINKHENVLATRIDETKGKSVQSQLPEVGYDSISRTLQYRKNESYFTERTIGILCAGTSDLPVAEEAAQTALLMGNPVKRFYDIGVAGIHRLFAQLEEIKTCSVLIVIAGMEGALPSVVGGLVQQPIIAVPTSVGYGTNFQGVSALLSMLNSCSSGITVVNIDNGFGAAYSAVLINRLK